MKPIQTKEEIVRQILTLNEDLVLAMQIHDKTSIEEIKYDINYLINKYLKHGNEEM